MIGPQPGDKTKKYTVTQASFKRPLYLLRSVTRPDLQYSIGLYCNKVLRYLQYCQRICNLESKKNWQDVNYDIQVDTVFMLTPTGT